MVPVSHDPVEPALSLRIDHAGRSVSFSGDTLYDERFVTLSKGVDLMLHDAMQHRMINLMEIRLRVLNPDSPGVKFLLDIVDYHANPEDAARAANKAGAKTLILTHIAPPLPTRLLYPPFLGDANDFFNGEIVVGEDGMIFNLKAK
jgi:ribonuclease Z